MIKKIRQWHCRNRPRLARDALVLGPSAALDRDPTTTPSVKNSAQTIPQLCVPQQSTTSQPPRLVCRSGKLQEQGFSVEVAERITAPQRSSTRTTYKSKWALFEKWCRENSVDFSTPTVKQISDFFMYLYQDLNRCPSTIDGYRTAIVDTLGPTGHHIAHNADLHRLLSSFHRDCPKSSRNLPKWNLSVVLNELTKAPLEPMKDTDLKHLTLKIAFLLALASGKRRSEIHAWVANKVSNLGQWEKVALFPSSDFIAKNQLATCFDYHCRYTIQRRQDLVSGAGPEVLLGSNQRPERVSIPPFHLFQEGTHLRHQTRYSLFLVETNHSSLL